MKADKKVEAKRDRLRFWIAYAFIVLFVIAMARYLYVLNYPDPKAATSYLQSKGQSHVQLLITHEGGYRVWGIGNGCGRMQAVFVFTTDESERHDSYIYMCRGLSHWNVIEQPKQ